jgi:hypothetical protein
MDAFIEGTLLWTKADGSPGILDDGATTPEHLAKLEEAVKALEIYPENFVSVGEDREDYDDDAQLRADRADLAALRWLSPFSNDGTPEDMKVLKAISRALVAAKAKMNIPCGVNADGESDLWLAQGVCAADVNIDLDEGEVLIGNGAFVGDVLCLRSPCCNKGDVLKLRAVAGRREWSHLRDVAVFPYRGDRPETDKMAGGDLDGDEYYIMLGRGACREIVWLARQAAPAIYATRDPRSDDELRAIAAADAALKASTVFSPCAAATPPSAAAMISSLHLCEIRTSDAPRHRRDFVPVTASAHWLISTQVCASFWIAGNWFLGRPSIGCWQLIGPGSPRTRQKAGRGVTSWRWMCGRLGVATRSRTPSTRRRGALGRRRSSSRAGFQAAQRRRGANSSTANILSCPGCSTATKKSSMPSTSASSSYNSTSMTL